MKNVISVEADSRSVLIGQRHISCIIRCSAMNCINPCINGNIEVYAVCVSFRGKIDVACLERHIIQALADGKVPLMVNATASTTVFGAFDPINDIADVCERHNIWLHVDVSSLSVHVSS